MLPLKAIRMNWSSFVLLPLLLNLGCAAAPSKLQCPKPEAYPLPEAALMVPPPPPWHFRERLSSILQGQP